MTKGHGEQTTDESLSMSTSTSISIPSRYPSISETMATKKDGSKKTDYGSLPLESSEQDMKPLLGPSKENSEYSIDSSLPYML